MDNKTTIGIIITTVLIAGGLIWYEQNKITKEEVRAVALATQSTQNLSLAQCLAEKGAKFYGAIWCPHCRDQKLTFAIPNYVKKSLGDAAGQKVIDASPVAKALPYIECAVPDGRGGFAQEMTPACTAATIQNFPTWIFADGSRMTGEVPLATLAERTGCALPAQSN